MMMDLKSLCFTHGWSYAVFWGYDSINPMLLRIEQVHNDEQSAAVVDDMILQTHILGQGIVGEAALTENHQWLFSDTLFQCEHEFQNQFLCGFKSIAIIPVGSSGVVQLGSTQKIVESPEMLEEIKRAFQWLKPDQSEDLDALFESLVPLESREIFPQGLSFDDIFTDDNNPPCLLSPKQSNSEVAIKPFPQQDDGDDFVLDILNSYSLDDLYQLLDDSPEHHHQDDSMVGINSYESWSVSHGKGLFSELISTSCVTNQSKRRKLETSSAHSSSFFPQFMDQAETVTPPPHEEGVKKKKKRAKAGESRRPRPKDRQMIQDRIKELRGMIPNGAKCSIDTLLDLTIRHMVFMQSIAKIADKLKQPYEPKLVKERDRTWALEVESVVCPIIVEDLKAQGQMQIEMVCQENEDHQLLQIAQVVRGLGLNILKGVMETREARIWAHFIVEAKPQVTRLQLFYSLVHLFQQQQTS